MEQLRQEVRRRVGRAACEHGEAQAERHLVVGCVHLSVCVAVGLEGDRGALASEGVF